MQDIADLVAHLQRTSTLSSTDARRIVLEVIAYFSETPEAYVKRRHHELHTRSDLRNDVIYRQIADELGQRRFAAPPLSLRQIRRIIYG
ncbi:MAG: hypothetical protein KDK91_06185 [Gammaproteobacteria bacterium]|nr:hypothetical protein [Gammaproteobacteria bacterium]